MNVIVLGAGGFIGTNLSAELSRDEKNRVTLVDRNRKNLYRAAALCQSRVVIEEKALDSHSDFDAILDGQDIVYHLVSSTVPTTSNREISKEIRDNVELMSELLEVCVRRCIKRIIFLSSGGTVYGMEHQCPLNEEMETQPINSYGTQKVMNEKLLYLYHYIHGLDYKIVRLANPFGPYQKPNGFQGVITTFLYKALRQEVISIYGDGSVVRDYVYIDDAIRAIINIANDGSKERIFNVGSGTGVSIHELLRIIEDVLGMSVNKEYFPGRKVDVPINFLDTSKYKAIFGNIVRISLNEGIRRTSDFIRKEYLSES